MAQGSPKFAHSIKQQEVVIPDLTIKELLEVIPAHCFKRDGWRSSLYVVGDFTALTVLYKTTSYLDGLITSEAVQLLHPFLYYASKFSLWAIYTFWAGLIGTGLWIIAHECGHQAFSESKFLNNAVGWVLHSGLGVPYHSWRISHAKHHASTSHLTQDQAYVPRDRAYLNLPALDATKEDLLGSSVTEEVRKELAEALGDSPIGTFLGALKYLTVGWPAYLLFNSSGQARYPFGLTNHFNPNAAIFSPKQRIQIIISDVGMFVWAAALCYSIGKFGFLEVFKIYLVPYLWVNHWIVLITFLQHTDPLLPHYRSGEFTFPRGALATCDRSLLGDLGPVMAWLAATLTHGISETHVAHHVHSKIPHYHAWEATDALRARLGKVGIQLQGRNSGWGEMYRVYKQCKFVEAEGDIVFYKNAQGLAAARPKVTGVGVDDGHDSGVDIPEKDL
ncbi:delta12-fatty acid desaturase [Thelephora ganbajun]|uniref:Delta12-fatty acid desaturase n=1 Tax=Thelephora ganbajun TaxID=370292 RepID=A0ACB6Z822_THEGA|nr:delta12-fatty acid desaturase [Thelephora ganbajun]